MTRRLWTREEQIRALELYLRTPFGKIHARNPEIITLADSLGRTTNAIALKMVNFAALDPTLPRKGMGNYSKSDADLWAEFFEAPSTFLEEAKVLLPKPHSGQNFNYSDGLDAFEGYEVREGEDIKRFVNTRKNQDFFRRMMLASYNGQCAATRINQIDLLIASHIKPWSEDKEARMNPRNGLLLNALHDRAFENGWITFDDDLNLIRSKRFTLSEMARPFFADVQLKKPERFAPDPAFLEHHRVFKFKDSPLSKT